MKSSFFKRCGFARPYIMRFCSTWFINTWIVHYVVSYLKMYVLKKFTKYLTLVYRNRNKLSTVIICLQRDKSWLYANKQQEEIKHFINANLIKQNKNKINHPLTPYPLPEKINKTNQKQQHFGVFLVFKHHFLFFLIDKQTDKYIHSSCTSKDYSVGQKKITLMVSLLFNQIRIVYMHVGL